MATTFVKYYVQAMGLARVIGDPPKNENMQYPFPGEQSMIPWDEDSSKEDIEAATKINENDLDPPNPNEKIVKQVIFWFGLRFRADFLAQDKFYEKLGFYVYDDILKDKGKEQPTPSIFIVEKQDVACRMGILKEWYFTIIPQDSKKTFPPYGMRFTSSIASSYRKTDQEVAAVLYLKEFKFGETNNKVTYIVERGTVKPKRTKRNAPSLP